MKTKNQQYLSKEITNKLPTHPSSLGVEFLIHNEDVLLDLTKDELFQLYSTLSVNTRIQLMIYLKNGKMGKNMPTTFEFFHGFIKAKKLKNL